MATNYKVSTADAQAMVEQWASMTPEVYNASPAQVQSLISHFTTEIQQDGSHTAFLDWAKSLPNQKGATPQTAQNFQNAVAQFTAQNGRAPYTPAVGAVQNQYPGTNTKTLGAEVGSAITSPVGQAIESVIAGALDVASGGALTPLTTAAEGGLQALGAGLQPGANAGSILKAGLTGAGEGGLAGLGAGALNNLTGGALESASANLPSAASMNPNALASVANASSGTTASPAVLGLPTGGSVASNAVNAGKTVAGVNAAANGQPSGGNSNSVLSTINSFLPTVATVAGAANAAGLQAQSQQYAQDALKQAQADYAAQAPLRSAGIAGMLNPSVALPGVSSLEALNTAAGKGNPFATAVPVSGSATASPSASVTGLPTGGAVSTQTQPPPALLNAAGAQGQPAGLPSVQPIAAQAQGGSNTSTVKAY